MTLRSLRTLAIGLAPVALSACLAIEPATGSPTPTAPVVGVDLGGSGRLPQIGGLAGEGEGYGRTEPNPNPIATSSMPGTSHGSMGGMRMDHSSMAGMSHGSMGSMPMDHGSMPGMSHGSKPMQMDHGSMPGMSHRSRGKTAAAQASSEMARGAKGDSTQMAHEGHAHVQGTAKVNSVDAAAHKVNLSHDPIPKIGWPSMTMDFAVAPSVDLNSVQPGTSIKFDMEQGQGGMYVIQSIAPVGGGRK